MAAPISAVCYYRMSSDQQDKSIPQQKAWAQAKVKVEGVSIEAEFQDEGISGDKTSLRTRFHQMLEFCQQRMRDGKPIEAIICYTASRFSRADSHETSAYIWQFRQAGVHRILTAERWIDWDKEEDRVIFNLLQDMTNHRYLVDLSQNIIRGKVSQVTAGKHGGGPATYGFDRMLVNEHGEPVRRLQRGVSYDRPKGWNTILVPSEDQEKVETVRWMFRTYEAEDVGFQGVARKLNQRGIPSPTGNFWGGLTVRAILTNPHYCGDFRWGRYATGRYHRYVNGEIIRVTKQTGQQANNDLVFHPDVHEPIIDRQLWNRVQAKIERNRKEGRVCRRGGYLLTGLLYCGKCGRRMQGKRDHAVIKGKLYTHRRYICSGHSRLAGACLPFSIREDKLLRVLIRKLQADYLQPDRLEALREQLKIELENERQEAPQDMDRLHDRLAELDRTIAQGRRWALKAKDDETFVQYNRQLQEWVEQREALKRQIAELAKRKDEAPEAIERMIDAAVDQLYRLKERIGAAEVSELREVFREMVSRIEVHFEQVPRKRKQWFRLHHGIIKLRPILEIKQVGMENKSIASKTTELQIVFTFADLNAA